MAGRSIRAIAAALGRAFDLETLLLPPARKPAQGRKKVGAALAFSFRYRTGAEPGRKGHRDEAEAEADQRVSPAGWIDSFAGRIEEAGGGLPRMGLIIILVCIAWYFAYLFLYWSPR